jgi:hypothetical protein
MDELVGGDTGVWTKVIAKLGGHIESLRAVRKAVANEKES